MIKISMKRFNKVVELKLPTEHEHVMLGLWRLGLQRDPAKYTLRELNAVISYRKGVEGPAASRNRRTSQSRTGADPCTLL